MVYPFNILSHFIAIRSAPVEKSSCAPTEVDMAYKFEVNRLL